ncbi:YchJ family protein [uncultured Shewanella sp.]|uniref:YchJ family protein n=1 Tax=uncultured Shewanella sp. TaxID=173975 RepID=UPI00262EEBB7|nr:YchJ family protein [uncultured Shewanella sp.]
MIETASYEPSSLCPCGSMQPYGQCCYLSHQDHTQASSPEKLMRSRYSAFAIKKFDYIIATQHPDYQNGLTVEQLANDPQPQWLGLEVLNSEQRSKEGIVIFKAWFKQNKQLDVIYERSNFILQNKLWYYTDGEQQQCALPKRNQSCICHSGKKFKQCCMP